MPQPIKSVLRLALTKELLLDLEDGLRGEALKAFSVVRDHTGLNTKRAREGEGQLRFRMMEQRFETVCQLHGWMLLDGGIIPHTDLKVFQPYVRVEVEGRGIIFGMASIPEPKALPSKNMSREAGVSCNYELVPRLDFDGTGPKIGDIFALLLVSRDRQKAGQIEEVAVGVIDAEYQSFLFYEPLDEFLRGGEADAGVSPSPTPPASPPVTLKKGVFPFIPPEHQPIDDKESGTK